MSGTLHVAKTARPGERRSTSFRRPRAAWTSAAACALWAGALGAGVLGAGALGAGALGIGALGSSAEAQTASDPFEALAQAGANAVLVPPRALAVIPERHVGRGLRMVDVLLRIEPQFDDLARGAGLNPERAIQLRTREANIPIFVLKNDATVSTVLRLELGAPVEVRGMLIERGGRYLFLASEVRPSPSRPRR